MCDGHRSDRHQKGRKPSDVLKKFDLSVVYLTTGALPSYGYRPADVSQALRAFGGLPTVTVEDAEIVAEALDRAERGMDFADALHLGKSTHCEGFATFDRKFVKAARAAGYAKVREA